MLFLLAMFGCLQTRCVAHTYLLAVPVMLLLTITVNVAYATCGDYLKLPGEERHNSAGELVFNASGDMPYEGPAPCRGPSCQGVPHAPLPTAPERSLNYDLERWCASLAEDAHSADDFTRLQGNETLLIPSGFASRIDRPPRG